ncbi:MAG TPA: DNA-formamidopyrimidine glycosylase family protein [Planctomycetota bacterium]|nr:DNA-formamidopyrimidine glycosylase family protein [Planctomycetota bacterium]
MPELPDIKLYLHALRPRVVGRILKRCRVASPFVLRSVDPPISALSGKRVVNLRRLGKRIVFDCENDLFLIIHLMIAGRLQWREPGAKIIGKIGLAAFDFENGTLLLTEAASKRRAAIYVVRGEDALRELDPGGLEVLDATLAQFKETLQSERHTLKRALTSPNLFSGIGNAYSDEILLYAKLSPMKFTTSLSDEEIAALYDASRRVLTEWCARLIDQAGDEFPERLTAFRPEMAAHGKFGKPCPVCCTPIQRIVYAENEANYCPTCQTGAKLLADRALSRLMRGDWPRTLEELEELKARERAIVSGSTPSTPSPKISSSTPARSRSRPSRSNSPRDGRE